MTDNKVAGFFDELSRAAAAINDVLNKPAEEPKPEQKPVLLTAAKLQELRWMTSRQIAVLYKHGKVPVKIEDSPKAYQQLRWMSSNQLEALFGKEEM